MVSVSEEGSPFGHSVLGNSSELDITDWKWTPGLGRSIGRRCIETRFIYDLDIHLILKYLWLILTRERFLFCEKFQK